MLSMFKRWYILSVRGKENKAYISYINKLLSGKNVDYILSPVDYIFILLLVTSLYMKLHISFAYFLDCCFFNILM